MFLKNLLLFDLLVFKYYDNQSYIFCKFNFVECKSSITFEQVFTPREQ